MKTKREALEHIAKYGSCEGISCEDCPYEDEDSGVCCLEMYPSNKLTKIGAMAILRMFKKKKKPLLSAGTKIKFSDGSIATILLDRGISPILVFTNDKGREYEHMEYLVGKTWEVVE